MSFIGKMVLVVFISAITVKALDLFFLQAKIVEETGNGRFVNLREYAPGFKAVFTPTPSYLDAADSLTVKPYDLTVDSDGFISNGNIHPDSETPETKIIFFGGSTTESLFVTEANRFTSRLERNLREITQSKLVVLNAGHSGNHSLHSLIALLGKGINTKPSHVVLMNNANDLSLLRKTGSYWKAPASRAILRVIEDENTAYSIAKKLKDWFAPNLYRYLKPRLFNKAADEFDGFRATVLDPKEFIPAYESSLRSFVRVAKAWNIEPILMTQFSRFSLSDELFLKNYGGIDTGKFVEEFEMMNKVIKRVASTEGCDLIDLNKAVPASSDYIYDSIHLNDEGSLIVAETLTTYFASRLTR